jgi:hypothetical protein
MEGTLQQLAHSDGSIHCVFISCDLPYQYMEDYFKKLGESHFHDITNKVTESIMLETYSTLLLIKFLEPSWSGPTPIR